MNRKTYGYIRVSSRDQNEDRQRIAMREFGIPDDFIFMDKQSGKDFERPGYKRLMRKIKPADTLVIKSIDRLGRNYDEILEQWRLITKERQIASVVLDMPLLDTRQGRDLHQRQAEGIAAAKAKGVKFGRRPMERPLEFEAVRDEWRAGRLSARKAALQLGITHRTFLAWATEVFSG